MMNIGHLLADTKQKQEGCDVARKLPDAACCLFIIPD